MDSKSNHRINLNIGGKLIETTLSTLLSTSTTTTNPLFIDADPHIFSRFRITQPLLSLSPFYATVSTTLSPPLHPLISTFSSSSPTSLLLAHGGLISSYHPTSLSPLYTTRTHLDHISSISAVSSTVSAVGSHSSSPPGLHFFNSSSSSHLASVLWSDPFDPRTYKSRVTAVNSDDSDSESTHLFASFDCRHGENAVLEIDKSTLLVVSEIGQQTGNSAKSAALTKLKWVPSLGVLVRSSISGGAFGYSGYIRMWDPRSREVVWERGEWGEE